MTGHKVYAIKGDNQLYFRGSKDRGLLPYNKAWGLFDYASLYRKKSTAKGLATLILHRDGIHCVVQEYQLAYNGTV